MVSFSKTFKKLDIFKRSMPGFNLRGNESVGTLFGSFLSICLIILIFLYGLIKFDKLVERLDPTIFSIEQPQQFHDQVKSVNLKKAGLKFAFTVENVAGNKTLLDPRYVKLIASIVQKRRSPPKSKKHKILNHHSCTEDELLEFAPADASTQLLMNKYSNSEDLTFICLDQEQDEDVLKVGSSDEEEHGFEIMLVPCNFDNSILDGMEDQIYDECIADEKAQQDYLEDYRFMVLASSQ